MLYKLKLNKTSNNTHLNNTVLEQLEVIFSFTSYTTVYVDAINIFTQTIIVRAEESEDNFNSIFHFDLSSLGLLYMVLENSLACYRNPLHLAATAILKRFDKRLELDTSQILF